MNSNILTKIESAARRRNENWRSHPKTDPHTSAHMGARLEELYASLRLERARTQHGDPIEIRRRARIEREIERLMSDNGD